MSQVSSDIGCLKTFPNHIGPRNKTFGRTLGESSGFRLRMSQDPDRFKSQFRNGVDENIPNQFPRFPGFSSSIIQSRFTEESRKNEESRLFPSRTIQSRMSTFHPDNGFRTSSSSRAFGFVSNELNPSTSGMINEDLRRNPFANSSGFHRTQTFEGSFNGSRALDSRKENAFMQSRCHSVMGRSNLHDYDLNRRNNSSFMSRSVFHQSRNLHPEGNSRLYQELSTVDFNNRYNDSENFKGPYNVKQIRGRNSILSSKLNDLDMRTHYRDFNNINGSDMSVISRKGMDVMSDSRLYLNTHSNTIDNQSSTKSILNASIKYHITGLIDNIRESLMHHTVPDGTADPMRTEFEKVTQMLEKILETSFSNSVRDPDSASVMSHSKYIRPPESNVSVDLDGGCRNLKSGKEIIKTWLRSKTSNNLDLTSSEEDVADTKGKKDSSFVFKKPKVPRGRKKMVVTSQQSKDTESKVISLRQWYPIATGSELALCGVDQKGVTVKTSPIKKRLSNRRVELTNGMSCDLLGSPSNIISELPNKIKDSLKNGLTAHWRVLQRDLINSQTSEDKRSTKGSREGSSQKKAKVSPKGKRNSGKLETPKVISTPKLKRPPLQTRSGRLVKLRTSPSKINQRFTPKLKTSTLKAKALKASEKAKKPVKSTSPEMSSPRKRGGNLASPGKSIEATPKKKAGGSVGRGREKVVSPERSPKKTTTKKSPTGNRKSASSRRKRTQRKQAKMESSKTTEKIDVDKEVEMIMSGGESPKKTRERKRKLPEDSDSSESKKKTRGLTLASFSSKSGKTTVKKKTETVKKKTAREKVEAKETTETENDFDFKLDDIEIPEFSSVCANPQLSRSQLRLVSMETPPLKYFNTNLKLLSSATPVRSPDWCISRRTESEVKQFQKRRVEALKKTKVDVRKTIYTSTESNVNNRDVKRVMEWVAEKSVQSPVWNSKVLQYVMPGRKLREKQQYEEEEEDDEEGGGHGEAGLL